MAQDKNSNNTFQSFCYANKTMCPIYIISIESMKTISTILETFIKFCIMLEFLIGTIIIYREKKLSLPELYFIAENSKNLQNAKKLYTAERRTIISFIVLFITVYVIPISVEIIYQSKNLASLLSEETYAPDVISCSFYTKMGIRELILFNYFF